MTFIDRIEQAIDEWLASSFNDPAAIIIHRGQRSPLKAAAAGTSLQDGSDCLQGDGAISVNNLPVYFSTGIAGPAIVDRKTLTALDRANLITRT